MAPVSYTHLDVYKRQAKAVQAVFRQLALSPVTDEQVEAVTYAHGSKAVSYTHLFLEFV